MNNDPIKNLEDRIDADYMGCFPSDAGWEKAAAHLLLAYDFAVRAGTTKIVDKMKYALMHALRWGRNAQSCAFRAYPSDFEPPLFEMCRDVLRRGTEYVGICGGFISYHQGLVLVDRIEERRIEFTANPSWKAYDVLDERLTFRTRPLSFGPVQEVQRIAVQLTEGFESLRPSEMMHWFPDFGTGRKLLSPVNNLLRESFSLPSSWQFDGIPVFRLRDFWRAVVILGLIHCAVAYRLTGADRTGLVQLLIKPRDDLADWIAGCVGIEKEVALRILGFHTYDRSHRTPDIAVTPFVPIDNRLIAASPWMLVSSAFERNFRAHVARQQRKPHDDISNALAPHLGNELVTMFRDAGFKAAHSIPFKTDDEQGDIDLLVWSPGERHVLAAELKWIIDTADFMEVLNRGEKTCREAMERQLPKYVKIMSEDIGAFIAKVFRLESRPPVESWSCGIVVRGFVGSPRVSDERYFLLPDSLLKTTLHKGISLRDFCTWARTTPYLPREGHDFRMYPVEVVSPSGIQVKFWEWEDVKVEG